MLRDIKLPNSQQEITATLLVFVAAVFAAFARLMYGEDELTKRRFIGSLLVAGVIGVAFYSGISHFMGELSGYAGVFIGAMSGTFTDNLLRYLQRWMKQKAKAGGLEPDKDSDG